MLLIGIILGWAGPSLAQLEVSKIPETIELKEKDGGCLDGSPWSSSSLSEKGKVQVLFYVDPDEKDANTKFEDELKVKADDEGYEFDSVAVINMAATWKPNWIISSILEGKQKKFSDTLYLKDLKKVLVSKWSLKDDAYNVVIFDKSGKVVFLKSGVLSAEEMESAYSTIKENM